MAKASKPAPLPVTTEAIGKAAETNAIRELVALATAFTRAGIYGPFEMDLPPLCSAMIAGGKGYRKCQMPAGAKFQTRSISLGKKAGLIFSFTPDQELPRPGSPDDKVEWIELGWDDVINHFGPLVDRIAAYFDDDNSDAAWKRVGQIDERIKAVIAKNPSMHSILTKGFALAQTQAKEDATDDAIEAIPGFGMF